MVGGMLVVFVKVTRVGGLEGKLIFSFLLDVQVKVLTLLVTCSEHV